MNTDPFFDYIRDKNLLSNNIYKEFARYKTYSRFPPTPLPNPQECNNSFSKTIQSRESIREYTDKPISLQQTSNLLFWSAGLSGRENGNEIKRAYPSGGARYPIELYLVVLKEGELSRGAYHYDAVLHQLIRLPMINIDKLEKSVIGKDFFAGKCGMLIVFSFKKSRSVGKYGTIAYKLALIESGAIGQNIYLTAPAVGLGCCALGGGSKIQRNIEELLYCDNDESVIYRIAVGNI